ncbi:lysyl-tRNA synthetase [Mycobacteroides abscessus subsp. abscessus]|nr:lysyl-tRNA synthetase [Mycobacteroides abscessus subsp. abscessus]
MAELTRDLIQQAARDAFDLSEGEEIVRLADGTEYDLSGEWDRIDLYGSTSEALGEEITVETPRETLVKYAERIGLEVDDYAVSAYLRLRLPGGHLPADPLPPLAPRPHRKVGPVRARLRDGHRLLRAG